MSLMRDHESNGETIKRKHGELDYKKEELQVKKITKNKMKRQMRDSEPYLQYISSILARQQAKDELNRITGDKQEQVTMKIHERPINVNTLLVLKTPHLKILSLSTSSRKLSVSANVQCGRRVHREGCSPVQLEGNWQDVPRALRCVIDQPRSSTFLGVILSCLREKLEDLCVNVLLLIAFCWE